MSLPISFSWETILVILTGGFSVLSFFWAAVILVHKMEIRASGYLVLLCLLWGVVEFVQLFVDGFAMSGDISNFGSSYLLLAAVTTTLSLYLPLSLITNRGLKSRSFVLYLAPLLVLCVIYTLVWYLEVAQEHRYYAFPDVWNNEFTWDLFFCVICFLYIIANALYAIAMMMSFAGYCDRFVRENDGPHGSVKKQVRDSSYLVYTLMAFFIMYLSQGTAEFAVAYKLALLVIVATFFMNYMMFMEHYDFSSHASMHDVYDIKWSPSHFAWDVRRRNPAGDVSGMQQLAPRTIQDSSSNEMLLTEDQVETLRSKLDEWMETEKPYLNNNFKVADVHRYLNIDRFECNELFARAYNCYFRTWVLHYRIDYAIFLMKHHPEKQIKMIAYESGFSSQTVFARSFYNLMGMTCSDYRRNYMTA